MAPPGPLPMTTISALRPAIKRECRQTFEVADEVTVETDTGILPRSDLFGALLRRLVMKPFSTTCDTKRIETERRELHWRAEVIRHLRVLRQDELREVVVGRGKFW